MYWKSAKSTIYIDKDPENSLELLVHYILFEFQMF